MNFVVKDVGRKFAMARTPSPTREPRVLPGVRGVLSDGNDGNRFDVSCLGLVGDQLAQERNQHDERDTDREAADAKLCEEPVLCETSWPMDSRARSSCVQLGEAKSNWP